MLNSGSAEIGVVEQVVGLGAERECRLLSDAEALQQGRIHVEEARSAERVATRCADVAGFRVAEERFLLPR